jgi:hypothetical protein
MYILGAGMAGLLAAVLNPKAVILEAAAEPPNNHNAVLRFRTPQIGNITGMPFRKVQVRKAIWYDGRLFSDCDPRMANLYSQKVSGSVLNRSIWNLEPVERYIAPPDFNVQLLDMLGARIMYGTDINHIDANQIDHSGDAVWRAGMPIISTMPMPVLARVCGVDVPAVFQHQSITTEKWRVANCDVHQTIYFPGHYTSLYRATLTGDELILESAGAADFSVEEAAEAFGLQLSDLSFIKGGVQKYGKIAPVPDSLRKNFMFRMSSELGIYSLGRYATWRNILLDDVHDDIFKIRQLMKMGNYNIFKELS